MLFTNSIKHPNEFSMITGKTTLVRELESVSQSIRLILLSERGELFGDPNYGSRLKRLLMEQMTPTLYDLIRNEIADSVNSQDTRVFINPEDIEVTEDNTTVRLRVPFQLRRTGYTADTDITISRGAMIGAY